MSIDLGIITSPPGEEERQERRDAAENRQLILETAGRLFVAHGVAAVNMADIAKEACVGKGTLYRRFSSKGELCLSILDEELRRFQDRLLSELRQLTDSRVSPLVQLDHFLEQLVFFIEENLELTVEIDRVTVAGQVENINTPHFWQELTIRGLLGQAQKLGEIRPDIDVDYVTIALLAPLDGRIFRSHREIKGYSLDRIVDGLRQLLFGLRTP